MTIFKLSIWTVLILALIPTSEGNRYSLYKIATGAMQDMGNFCARTPETCQQAQNAFFSLKDKAYYIGNAVSGVFTNSSIKTAAIDDPASDLKQTADDDSLGNNRNQTDYDADDRDQSTSRQSEPSISQDTLSRQDKNIEWVAPEKETAIYRERAITNDRWSTNRQ